VVLRVVNFSLTDDGFRHDSTTVLLRAPVNFFAFIITFLSTYCDNTDIVTR